MKYVVEVAHMVNGDLVAMRRLSFRRERAGGLAAVAAVAALSVVAMLGATIAVQALGRSIYAPWFAAVWVATAVVAGALASKVVRRRLSRFVVGTRLDADAYAPTHVDLVRRVGDQFELTIVPGMTGHVEGGRAPMPVEALVTDQARTIVLDEGATAHLSVPPSWGASIFVVRSRQGEAAEDAWISRDFFRLFSRIAAMGVQVALVASLFAIVPSGQTIGDRPAHLFAPRITTAWEAEKWLRVEAQAQARSLHRCFDQLPVSCQHPGYVGVGVSLTRDGEIRSNWIARSTYGTDCPVDACVKDVVSTWIFDPLPEPMRVILPVQVLRTDKPLPKVAAAQPSQATLNPAVLCGAGIE